ncbi:MAG TPA: nicotinate-nucleotide adenylyltransferase [Pyrinomonadaceae bacterium]|jgi:nicotinate-nucleotide adenylyltransferase|nr:nicotinate-nucleotide adenylyltransferase [Pyrinomonadaceae bacterium]
MNRIAYFGGTFDPVHNGHLKIARTLVEFFRLDRFYFLPAFHAPHKADRTPTSPYRRFAMLSIATRNDSNIFVSTHELDQGEPRYTADTISELQGIFPRSKLFFVMGADSWMDIRTWRRWEDLLLMTDHIVVARPGFEIGVSHITDDARRRIQDIRGRDKSVVPENDRDRHAIYITDAVHFETSSSALREDLSDGELDRDSDIPIEVANYIEKYELYR